MRFSQPTSRVRSLWRDLWSAIRPHRPAHDVVHQRIPTVHLRAATVLLLQAYPTTATLVAVLTAFCVLVASFVGVAPAWYVMLAAVVASIAIPFLSDERLRKPSLVDGVAHPGSVA
jgi:hypothetical protein